jgi:hypothetical protein
VLWFTILHYGYNPNVMRRKRLDHDRFIGNMVKCNEVHAVIAHMARTGLSQAEVLRMVGLDERRFERWFERRMEFIEDLEPVMFVRRFFVTEGLYFGLGSRSARYTTIACWIEYSLVESMEALNRREICNWWSRRRRSERSDIRVRRDAARRLTGAAFGGVLAYSHPPWRNAERQILSIAVHSL